MSSPFLSSIVFRPLVWVGATLASRIAVANLLWHWERSRHSPGSLPDRVLRLAESKPLAAAATAAYMAGPFLLSAALRIAEPADLGLRAPTSPISGVLAIAAGLLAGALLALQLGRLAREGLVPPRSRGRADPAELVEVAFAAFLLEAHWAFLRSGPLSAGLANETLAVFCGLALVALEGWSQPQSRAAFVDPEGAAALMPFGALAVISALTFILSGSSLVALAVHLAIAFGLSGFGFAWHSRDAEPTGVGVPVEPTVV